ncbi:MAG: ACT domain-containing protein [Polyangiaceae bacterium]
MPQIIVTAVGPDRTGIVADLSKTVHDRGASIADSRMVNLRGHFALLALVEGPTEALTALREHLQRDREKLGLRIELQDAPVGSGPLPGGLPYRLKVYAVDQPGIVARLTERLHSRSVNVEELETRVESAPFAGTPLFQLEAVVTLPKGTNVRKLRDELITLGDDIGCDVDLDPM